MNTRWVTLLLCAVFAFGAVGCAKNEPRRDRKGRWAPAQTGTNLRRWVDESAARNQTRETRRVSKAKRERRNAEKARPEKPKRERQERRRRAADDEVITRGGFR